MTYIPFWVAFYYYPRNRNGIDGIMGMALVWNGTTFGNHTNDESTPSCCDVSWLCCAPPWGLYGCSVPILLPKIWMLNSGIKQIWQIESVWYNYSMAQGPVVGAPQRQLVWHLVAFEHCGSIGCETLGGGCPYGELSYFNFVLVLVHKVHSIFDSHSIISRG